MATQALVLSRTKNLWKRIVGYVGVISMCGRYAMINDAYKMLTLKLASLFQNAGDSHSAVKVNYGCDSIWPHTLVQYDDGTIIAIVCRALPKTAMKNPSLLGVPSKHPQDQVVSPSIAETVTNLSTKTTLSRTSVVDPNNGDSMVYDMCCGTSPKPQLIFNGRTICWSSAHLRDWRASCSQIVACDAEETPKDSEIILRCL